MAAAARMTTLAASRAMRAAIAGGVRARELVSRVFHIVHVCLCFRLDFMILLFTL